MNKVKPEHYKAAYDKLYAFLRYNHPEIIEEYNQRLKEAKAATDSMVILGTQNVDCPMSSCDDNIFSWACRVNIEHGHCKKFKSIKELDALGKGAKV